MQLSIPFVLFNLFISFFTESRVECEYVSTILPRKGGYMEENDLGITSMGIRPNIAGFLCYLFGFVSGIFFLIIEKENKFVRYHALQSTLAFAILFIVKVILIAIPLIGWALLPVLGIVAIIVWVFSMYKAYQGEYFKLPIIGNMAEHKSE